MQLFERISRARAVGYLTVLLGVFALYTHLTVALQTVVFAPVRADAAEYAAYAYNLKTHGKYSREITYNQSRSTRPPASSDAVRPPLYPLMLMPLIQGTPDQGDTTRIVTVQALLGAATVVLAFLLYQTFLPLGLAFIPAVMTAVCARLLSMDTYILTETLFTLVLTTALYLGCTALGTRRSPWSAATGAAVALGALTRPVLQYLILVLAALFAFHKPKKTMRRNAIACALGFAAAFAPWAMFTSFHISGDSGANRLTVNTLHHGMYPNMMYQGRPETYGFPYDADPRSEQISQSVGSVLHEIVRRFREEPVRHAKWYIIGKPVTFLSWDIISGQGGIFVYPVLLSPYANNIFLQSTHALLKMLHWPLIAFALLACVAVWLPQSRSLMSEQQRRSGQLLSLTVGYFLAVHIVGAPFPRYSIPLMPVLYGMAVFGPWLLTQWLKERRGTPAATQ